jgi:hypothetical protein
VGTHRLPPDGDVDAARADLERVLHRTVPGIDLQEIGAAAGDPDAAVRPDHALGRVARKNRELARAIRAQVDAVQHTVAVADHPGAAAAEDDVRGTVAHAWPAHDAVRARVDTDHRGSLIVRDPDRAAADPDVVRGRRAQEQALDDFPEAGLMR